MYTTNVIDYKLIRKVPNLKTLILHVHHLPLYLFLNSVFYKLTLLSIPL